jgi:hypothetical protein
MLKHGLVKKVWKEKQPTFPLRFNLLQPCPHPLVSQHSQKSYLSFPSLSLSLSLSFRCVADR